MGERIRGTVHLAGRPTGWLDWNCSTSFSVVTRFWFCFEAEKNILLFLHFIFNFRYIRFVCLKKQLIIISANFMLMYTYVLTLDWKFRPSPFLPFFNWSKAEWGTAFLYRLVHPLCSVRMFGSRVSVLNREKFCLQYLREHMQLAGLPGPCLA